MPSCEISSISLFTHCNYYTQRRSCFGRDVARSNFCETRITYVHDTYSMGGRRETRLRASSSTCRIQQQSIEVMMISKLMLIKNESIKHCGFLKYLIFQYPTLFAEISAFEWIFPVAHHAPITMNLSEEFRESDRSLLTAVMDSLMITVY